MKTTVCSLGRRMRKLGRTWPAIMLMAFAIEYPSAFADDAKPNFVFVDGAAVTLSPDASNAFKFDVPIKNSGGKKGEASIQLLSNKDKRCGQARVVDPNAKISLEPNAVVITHFEITNDELPATCYIALVTEGEGNTSLKQIKLTQQYLTTVPVLVLLGICAAMSVLIALSAWGAARISWRFKLGSPAWEFTKSWTTTTTLVATIISTALTLSALPELTDYASKSGYSVLALMISFAVIIAPFVFIFFRWGEIKEDNASKNVVYEGYLLPFLISCTITLFAGLAQLVVLFLLLSEVFKEYRFWFYPGWALAFVLGAALCWHACRSMFLTINLQVADNAKKAAAQSAANEAAAQLKAIDGRTDEKAVAQRKAIEDAERKAIEGVKGPLLTWPIL